MREEQESQSLAYIIEEDQADIRVDRFLAEKTEEAYSRSLLQQWIKDGLITVNGGPCKANYRLSPYDEVIIQIPAPEEMELVPENIPLDVVYEDSDVIVVNKARGMVVHPAAGHRSGTLVHALLYHCKDLSGINGTYRPGIVHRIDKDTTGLLMAAKNDVAHHLLAEQLRVHSNERRYKALVHGIVVHDRGTIDAPIGRDAKERQAMMVTDRNSKNAVTHFTVLERLAEHTLLELELETGRTHQIRVHMKYIHHPMVGDPKYGRKRDDGFKGQALHAAVLGFIHPRTKEAMRFEAPLPDDFVELLQSLR